MANKLSSALSPKSIIEQAKKDKVKPSIKAVEIGTNLLEDPEFQRLAPPETQSEVAQAVQQANDTYGERANRNDWLDVAQTLSRAVAQLGAASSGLRSGRDMSGLNFGPGIDFNARSERALAQSTQQKRDAYEAAENRRRNWIDEQSLRDTMYSRAESRADKTAAQLRADEEAKAQERARSEQGKKESDALLRQGLRDTYGSLDDEAKGLSKAVQEAQGAMTAIPILTEAIRKAGSKDKPKLQLELTQQFQKIGLDPAEIEAIKLSPANQKSALFGLSEKPDEEKINSLVSGKIKEQVDALKARLNEVKQQRGSVYKQITGTPAAASAPTPKPAASPTSSGSENREALIAQYLQAMKKAGRTDITPEMAEKILITRGKIK